MDILKIDPVSYATRVAHMAAGEMYGLLSDKTEAPALEAWYRPGAPTLETHEIASQVLAMGGYVAAQTVTQGERLYRWAVMRGFIPPGIDWSALQLADRLAFEVFVDTARNAFGGLAIEQKAVTDAQAAAGIAPAVLKREDSIFDEQEPIGTLRPEAVAAGPMLERYQRARERADMETRQAAEAERKKQERKDAAAARKAAARPMTALSAGETLVAQQPNKGGRGKTKPTS